MMQCCVCHFLQVLRLLLGEFQNSAKRLDKLLNHKNLGNTISDKGSAIVQHPACHNHLFFKHRLMKLLCHFFSMIHLSISTVNHVQDKQKQYTIRCCQCGPCVKMNWPYSRTLLKLMFLPIQALHQSDIHIIYKTCCSANWYILAYFLLSSCTYHINLLEWKDFLQPIVKKKQKKTQIWLIFFYFVRFNRMVVCYTL